MPYIDLKTTKKLAPEVKTELKKAFGEAVSCFPGKTERWLMVNITDGADMWLGGDNSEDTAMLQVSLFGKGSEKAFDDMTDALCSIMENTAGVHSDRVYIKYGEVEHWGWNGGNF